MIVKAREDLKETKGKSSTSIHKRTNSLAIEVQRIYTANNQAMLGALRVVLAIPRKPISLKEDEQPQ